LASIIAIKYQKLFIAEENFIAIIIADKYIIAILLQ
jgi:hypothetical protein